MSPLVRRSFSLTTQEKDGESESKDPIEAQLQNGDTTTGGSNGDVQLQEKTVLRTEYKATTNRMLRVSVNGFLESMGVVLGVMQELDVDVLAEEQRQAEA